MGFLLILAGQISHVVEGMIVRSRSQKSENGGFLFNSFISLFSMLLFMITDTDGLHFPQELWVYSIISGCLYAGGFYFTFVALKYGSFGISKMLMTFVSLFPIAYGLVFLKESANAFTCAGICLAFAAVLLTNYAKSSKTEKTHISKIWTICIALTILCNGGIAILSRMQQIRFEAKYDNEFLIISLGLSFLILLVIGIFNDIVKRKMKVSEIIKNDLLYSAVVGITNGLNNLTGVIAYRYLAISVATPLKSGLGVVLGFLASIIIYKEKFSKIQFVGMAISVIALILLQM